MTVQTYTNLVTDPKGLGSPALWEEHGFIDGAGSGQFLDNTNVVLAGGPASAASYLHFPDLFWINNVNSDSYNAFGQGQQGEGTFPPPLSYPVVQATNYSLGFSGRTSFTGIVKFVIRVTYYGTSGQYLYSEDLLTPVTAADTWQDISDTITIPSGVTSIQVLFGLRVDMGALAPDDSYLDATAFYIVKNHGTDPYTGGFFDGDTPTQGSSFYSWTGTPNQSTSVATSDISLPVSELVNLPLVLEVYRNSDLDGRPAEFLNGRMNPTYLEELKGPGGGSFDIMVDDPKIVDDPTLLDYRNVVKVKRANQVLGAFVIQNTSEVYVDSDNEDAGRIISVSGEGLRTWFHDAVIYPMNGISPLSSNSRVFSWASEKSSWFEPADWHTPVNVMQLSNPSPSTLAWDVVSAQNFPDTSAWWIWDRPEGSWVNVPPNGYNYFRYEWDTTVTTNYVLYLAGDDTTDAYIDGQNVISQWTTWQQTTSTNFTLDPGHHVAAFRVLNGGNIGGLVAAMRSTGTPSAPVAEYTVFKTGDAGWLVNGYPASEPGWTAGDLLLKLLSEAQQRGVLFANLVVPTFTAELDSNGDPWGSNQAWEFNVGDEYQSVIDKLEELSCDIWIDPDTYALNAVRQRGTDRTTDRDIPTVDFTNQTQAINMLDNPSMVAGFDIHPVNCTLDANDTSWSAVGPNSANLWNPTSIDSYLAVGPDLGAGKFAFGMVPGGTYTFSGVGRIKGTGTGSDYIGPVNRARALIIHTTRADSNGNYLGSYDVYASENLPNTLGATGRVSVTVTLPMETTGVALRAYNGNSASQQVQWDALMLVEGDGLEADGATPLAYFDGDSQDTNLFSYRWAGRPNESSSVRTPMLSHAPVSPSGVSLRTGRNIISASEDVTGAVKNALLLSTQEGWTYKESSDPLASVYGRVEGSIQTDGGFDLATQVANYAFEEFSTPSTASSYDIIVSTDTVPWQDLYVGDLVKAAKRGYEDLATRRIYSLSCGEDEAGNISYAVEFDTLPKERIDRLEKMIDNITAGTTTSLLGSLSTVSGGLGATVNRSYSAGGGGGSTGGGTGGGGAVVPPSAPTGLQGTASGYWHQSLSYARAHLSWSPVTNDTGGSTLTVSRYDVWAKKNRTTAARTTTNLVSNPSFESNTTGVAASNCTFALSTAWAQSGTQSLKLTPSLASLESYVTLDGGDGGLRSGFATGNTFTVSAYIHLTAVQAGATSALARTLSVVYKDSGGAYHWETTAPAPNVVGTYRLALNVAIPVGATAAYIVLYNGTGNGAPTDVYWDGVQNVLGTTLPEYFDGSLTSDSEYAYAWTGTAHASTSTRIQTDSYEFLGSTESTSMNVERLDTGPYTFVVHAIISGAYSASSSALNLTLNGPDLLLAPPDDPSMVSVNGTVTVSWDGLLANAVPGKNFSYVYAGFASSSTGTFTPIGGTLVGAGQFVIANLTPGSLWYFKLYAVDKNGNVSSSSNAVAISVAAYSGSSGGSSGAFALAVPVGAVVPYAGSSLPSGYAFCDGSAVSRTTYADLYAAIGTTYGVGDGSTTFNLPNLKGRSMVGQDTSQTEFNTLGKTGGEKTHTLTTAEMPSHNHQFLYGGVDYASFPVSNGSGGNLNFAVGNSGFGPVSIDNTGGGGAHNNLQPYLTVNFVIKTTIDSAVPVGTSIEGYWSSAPAGYLLENGAAISRTTYAALFALIGTTYGTGDGSTTFNLPDSTGRVLVAKGSTGTFTTLGAKGGEETHVLSTTEMPTHHHGSSPPVTANADNPGSSYIPTASGSTYGTYFSPPVDAGGGAAHNNLQPYIVVNRAIKY